MAVKVKVKPLFIFIIFIVFIAILLLGMGSTYIYMTGPIDKNDKTVIEVEVKSGTNSSGIAKILKDNELIRNEFIFKLYLKLNNVSNLKAAIYKFDKSMSVEDLVKMLEAGSTYNPNAIKLTFKEGKWVIDYAKVISDNTDNNYDDVIKVFKDREYTKKLINKYWFLTDTILDQNIYYPLEGYLSPETYYFDDKSVSTEDIIERLLDETDNKLKPYKSKIGNNIHYYVTMASIVELEGTNTENRIDIVSVFKNRIKSGMNLGSDVTTYYGLQAPMTSDLTAEQFAASNAYNTRSTSMIGKMPIGPICNFSDSSLEASVTDKNSDYYFFVADKNGKIYFTKTNAEHIAKVNEIKQKGDWIW